MKSFIKIAIGLVIGLIMGGLLMGLITGWVGDEPNADEWYIPLIIIGLPALGGLGAGIFCALTFDEDGFSDWLFSVLIPIGIALIAAIIAVLIFGAMLLVWAMANMSVADWLLVALVVGLLGGGVIYIIFSFSS